MDWKTQVRKGLLEYSILLLISKGPVYGYSLLIQLEQWEPLTITEGTLYPLLRRLQKESYITYFWEESRTGPPRKYYELTQKGIRLLEQMTNEWNNMVSVIVELQEGKGGTTIGKSDE